MRIAIIGAGFFGTACAIRLSKKHNVHLFEKKNTILCGASRANQQRFHLGYHYPRSKKTIDEIKSNYKEFRNFFGNNVFGKTVNYYGICKERDNTEKLIFDYSQKNSLPILGVCRGSPERAS